VVGPEEVAIMRSLVVYESMYGNTHVVAEAIGRGLATAGPVAVVPVGEATAERVAEADLLVVGGPTHAHAMSRELTRKGAIEDARDPEKHLTLDPDAEGPGLREWFDELPVQVPKAAAFDTRFHLSPLVTGRASKGIGKRLRRQGVALVAEPESFFVEKGNVLEEGEAIRAESWGVTLAALVAEAQVEVAR
jgi:hypothetical protein